MEREEVLLRLLSNALVTMRAYANPASPDLRAVQALASGFHNVPLRMHEVSAEGRDLQVVLDELWTKNAHLPVVRETIVSYLDLAGLRVEDVFTAP